MASVCFDQVNKAYPGGVQAVRDLSLSIADGEFAVLLGPSGCGKSTILRLVAGLEKVSHGTIRIGERIVNRIPPKDRDVAMVFQNYALYPHMTVYKNLAFGLQMRKVQKAEIEQRVARVARLLGITDLLDRKPRAISGGQQQRVALGRAIVREPACFLFDEPLSNLDATLRVQMRAELKALHQRLRTTTIHVTHDQEEAMNLGDRVVVLCEGRVQQVGPPLEVYNRPANRFVAGFVGSPPMNLIEGRLIRRDGSTWFDDGKGAEIPLAHMDQRADQSVTLGLRPEAMVIDGAAGGTTLAAEIAVCEPLGDRMDVHVTTAQGTKLVARVQATESLHPGQPVRVGFDAGAIHLFEPGPFGRRLNDRA